MTAPQITPFVVDQTRLGGAGSTQRHGFNILPGPRWMKDSAKPAAAPNASNGRPSLPPPPMRLGALGYGLMQAPALTESKVQEIQAAVAPVIDGLQALLEGLKIEAQVVAPETIRENPDAYKGVNELGPYFTPQEMRSQVILDTKAVQAEASRLLSGAVSPYLMEAQAQTLETVVGDAKSLIAYTQQYDLAPISGAKSKLSEDHLKELVSGVREGVQETEKVVVTGEASSVPVAENSGNVLGTLVALGVLGAIGWLLYEQM